METDRTSARRAFCLHLLDEWLWASRLAAKDVLLDEVASCLVLVLDEGTSGNVEDLVQLLETEPGSLGNKVEDEDEGNH